MRLLALGAVLLAWSAGSWGKAVSSCPETPPGWTLSEERFLCTYRRGPGEGYFQIDWAPGAARPAAAPGAEDGSVGGRRVKWGLGTKGPVGGFGLVHTATFRPLDGEGAPRGLCGPWPKRPVAVTTWARDGKELLEIRQAVAAVKYETRPLSPPERFALADLQLVASGPAKDPAEQWAEFRDPSGALHRVQGRQPVGPNLGTLSQVAAGRVVVMEMCFDEKDGWTERKTPKGARPVRPN